MKVPLNWLGQYTKLPKKQSDLTDKLTMAGHMLDKVEKAEDQVVVDLELRGNRADCYSILGIAREVSALFGNTIKDPQILSKVKKVRQLKQCKISINNTNIKRVAAVIINNVKIETSPKWLARNLAAYGIAPINNIVDLTNYVMVETGEPMHAFDLDKIGNEVQIRAAKQGEKITTFLGSTLTLSKEDLVWANKRSLLSVAGAIGEKTHSISDSSKRILVEAANYDRANIRRTIHRYNLFTDAGIRHEKKLDPNLVEIALLRFAYLIHKYNWGKVEPYIFDYYPKPVKPWKITLEYSRIESLGGVEIDKKIMKNILIGLNFKINKEHTDTLELTVPTYRTDVTSEEDVIEEILRVYGYDKIPQRVLSLEIPRSITPNYITQEIEYKNSLTSLGFDEVISLPFVNSKSLHYNQFLWGKKIIAANVQNSPSPDLKQLRLTMLPNLLEHANKAINERAEEVCLCEIGKIYYKEKDKYTESRKLGIVYWKKEDNTFHTFKGLLETFFKKINLSNVQFEDPIVDINILNNAYLIKIGDDKIGLGGQVGDIYYTEIDLDILLSKTQNRSVKLWAKYPPQVEDITFVLPEHTKIGSVVDSIKQSDKLIKTAQLKDVYKNAYTFHVLYQHPDKTLTDKEVEKIRAKLVVMLEKKYGATVR